MATTADLRRVSKEELKCDLFRCFCCWRRRCSLGIPRIGPRSEYLWMPADVGDEGLGEDEWEGRARRGRRKKVALGGGEGKVRRPLSAGPASATTGDRPLWSVLVGCTSAGHPTHNLRIHCFRVSCSGRIIGHNNDLLELFCGVSPIDDKQMFAVARAAIVPADRREDLYIICAHERATSSSGQQTDEKMFHPKAFCLNTGDRSLCTLPPLPFARGSWEAISARGKLWVPLVLAETCSYGVAWHLIVYELIEDCWTEVKRVSFPYKHSLERGYRGTLLQGYVVLNSRYILLSFSNSVFYSFNCSNCMLSLVDTDGTSQYVPITGKGVHVKHDGMIYFMRGTTLFAYNYPPKQSSWLGAPIEINNIWPYHEEGYGFLEHLGDHILCAVWINMRRVCGCATRHALITTFSVIGVHQLGCFIPSGVNILHSTCRQIDMLRSNPEGYGCYDTFCFLHLKILKASFIPQSLRIWEDHTAPKLKSSRKCLLAAGGRLACSDKPLEAILRLDTVRFGDLGIDEASAWYFVHRGSTLHVIPSSPDCNHYVVDIESKSCRLYNSKRSKHFFSAVFRAGQCVVALCDTLQYVYILRDNFQWRRQKTSSVSVDVSRKVKVSGFVDLLDDAFIISDFDTEELLLFDWRRGEWSSVRSYFGFLSGRCIFAEGFIYTCSDRGLAAFELICDGTSYCLGVPIMLDFSWKYVCGRKRFICFDSICKGEIGNSIVFCMVQGYGQAPPSTSSHTLATTTVQVKLVEKALQTKKPVKVDHVDISLSSIVQEGLIMTNYAFAL